MDEKFYITTAIDYVNALPHLGHALEKTQADAIARYQRFLGKDVFFLTGTDEHGAKITRAAEAKGIKIADFVNETAEKFRFLAKELLISNDDFIRTSDKSRHWPGAKALWEKLVLSGDIYKADYKGLYCVGCEAFITQKDLAGGKCAVHNQEPEKIDEENYFFRLSRYQNQLKEIIESDRYEIIPETRKNEALSWFEAGLEDVSFSRPNKDISWGIPVPGDSSQTMYVWADALSNYITALGYGGSDINFKRYWPADIHVIGKDILRFHVLYWPAMLLSADLPLPKSLFVHGHIISGGKKMSKTLGNIVDPFDLINRYGSDALRHYLLKEISATGDGDLTEEKFKEVYNADLANGLGNLVSRVFKMAFLYFSGRVEKPDDVLLSQAPFKEKESELYSVPYVFEHKIWADYGTYMDTLELNRAADVVRSAISKLDSYIQDYQPFKLIGTDKEKTRAVLWGLLFGLTNVSRMLYPFMPKTAEKIAEGLGIGQVKIESVKDFSLKETVNLFPRKE